MKKYYEDAGDNAAFERFVDVLCRIVQKYGDRVLENQSQNARQEGNEPKADKQMITEKVA